MDKNKLLGRVGLSRPIICKRCGKKVGYVKIKTRFNAKLVMWGIAIAFTVNLITQFLSDLILHRLFS